MGPSYSRYAFAPRLNKSPFLIDVRLQPLSYLDFESVVHVPGGFVGDVFDQPGSARMAVAALLHAAEGQMNLGPDAWQVYVTHPIFAFIAEEAHGPVIFGNHGHRQAVFGVVVNASRFFVALERA